MAQNTQVELFWVVTLCIVALGYQRFGGLYWLHVHGDNVCVLCICFYMYNV